MKKMKLLPKTFIYTFSMLLIINLSLHFMIYFFYPKVYLNRVGHRMETQIGQLQKKLKKTENDQAGKVMLNFARKNQLNISVKTERSQKTYQGMDFQINLPTWEDIVFSVENIENKPSVIVKKCVLEEKNGGKIKALVMCSAKPLKEATDMIEFLLPVTFSSSILFSILFAWFYSKKITNPIVKMSKVTTDMKNRNPDAAFLVQTKDEMGILAEQMNEVYSCLLETIQKLDEEKLKMVEMEKAKTVFLRSASHELKTPLAGLRILLENMQYNIGKYKDRDQYLGEAIVMVDQLNDMVKNILDTSKLQENLIEEEKTEIVLKEKTEKILQKFEFQIIEKQIEVIMEIKEGTVIMMGQEDFDHVWSNLLSNAVCYTDNEGKIRIGGDEKSVWIENSCKPLTREQLQYIFEPFFRTDETRNKKNGNGLGLYVVREILKKEGKKWKFEPIENGMRFIIG